MKFTATVGALDLRSLLTGWRGLEREKHLNKVSMKVVDCGETLEASSTLMGCGIMSDRIIFDNLINRGQIIRTKTNRTDKER